MMKHLPHLLLFILVNAAGFYAIPLLTAGAAKLDLLPHFTSEAAGKTFQYWLAGVGMMVWVAAAVVSIGYFFSRTRLRHWLITAPLLAPLAYGIAVMLYFTYWV